MKTVVAHRKSATTCVTPSLRFGTFQGVNVAPACPVLASPRRYQEPLPATFSDTIATWATPSDDATTPSVSKPRNGFIRWYDPITSRWLSNDPIGISGGLNQYVFCANNPVNFVDPFGLDVWVAGRGLHQSINIGNPNGTFSSYSLMDVPAFTVFGVPIFLDPFNPWNNGGVIYRDYEPGKPDMSRYLHSSPSEDARASQIIDMMVGEHLPYRLIGSTCRSFSADMFDFFKDDMHIGGADKNGDPCK